MVSLKFFALTAAKWYRPLVSLVVTILSAFEMSLTVIPGTAPSVSVTIPLTSRGCCAYALYDNNIKQNNRARGVNFVMAVIILANDNQCITKFKL